MQSTSRRTSYRGLLAGIVVLATAAAGSAQAASPGAPLPLAAPTSVAFGGASGSIDTASKVKAVVQNILAAPSAASAGVVFEGLTPADQQTVIKQGLEVTSVTVGSPTPPAPPPTVASAARYSRHAKHVVLAHAAATTTHTQVATGRDVVGVTLYTYISEWHWGYNGSIVTSAGHSEYTGGTAPLWNYNGSVYLAPAGSVGSWYVGRQTQGKFTLSLPLYGVVQTSYATMWNYVNGAGGWSGYWSTSGL